MNEELVVRTKWGLIIVSVLCLAVYARCAYEKPVSNVPGKIVVEENKKGTSRNHNGPYIPPEGTTTITPKDPTKKIEDVVDIKYKTWGRTSDIGLQLGLIGGYSIGLDYKFFYVGRFGANIGLLGGKNITTYVTPDLTISYHLDRISWIHNTELWAGYAPTSIIPYQMGVRINI